MDKKLKGIFMDGKPVEKDRSTMVTRNGYWLPYNKDQGWTAPPSGFSTVEVQPYHHLTMIKPPVDSDPWYEDDNGDFRPMDMDWDGRSPLYLQAGRPLDVMFIERSRSFAYPNGFKFTYYRINTMYGSIVKEHSVFMECGFSKFIAKLEAKGYLGLWLDIDQAPLSGRQSVEYHERYQRRYDIGEEDGDGTL